MQRFSLKSFFLGDADIPPEKSSWVRAEQFNAYMGMAPIGAVASIVIGIVLSATYWEKAIWPLLFAWTYSSSVLAFLMMREWVKFRRSPRVTHQSSRDLRKVSSWAAFVGAVWGGIIALLMLDAAPMSIMFAGCLGMVLLSAGAFLLAMAPLASLLYMCALMSGLLLGALLVGDRFIFSAIPLYLSYVLLLQRYVSWTSSNFIKQRLDRRAVEESGEVISLLLHDFETHASDWLWEVDAEGRMNRVSMRFAEAVRRPRETLEGEAFLQFFHGEQAERLEEMLRHKRSFRDLITPVSIGSETRWWSISAQPRMGTDGDVVGYRGVCSDVTAARAAESKIAYMAHYDALTDLPNRSTFASELDKAIERLHADGEGFALHCIDLDNFKTINDTMGHPAGDTLLKTVATRLRQSTEEKDIIGRLGGDEFVILQTNVVNDMDATLLADFVVDSLLDPVQLEGQHTLVSGSVGSAIAPRDGDTAKELLKHADLALYAAKQSGRGCNRFFEPYMDEEARRRTQMEADLRKALYESELELHYQPLMDVRSGGIKGYESLLRWRRSEDDVILPADFIEIAEETGLIIPLGEWVIRTAIAEAASWPDEATVAINLSPIQMTNPSLISTVVNALAANDLAPSRIEFEITETVLLEETESNLKTLHALRDLGAKIALDDFGTGFSSLNYLRAFPFDKIKIDKCFVQEMEAREDCRAIIRAVMSLAQTLGMRTTAEGVETQRQVDMLSAEGCTEMQGFLFSQPIPGRDLPKRNTPSHVIMSNVARIRDNGRVFLLERKSA